MDELRNYKNCRVENVDANTLQKITKLVELGAMIDQIETFDLIRERYGLINHILRVTDQRVSWWRRPGTFTQFLLYWIQAISKEPTTEIIHPRTGRSIACSDYKIGRFTLNLHSNEAKQLGSGVGQKWSAYLESADAFIFLNQKLVCGVNLWRPKTTPSLEKIVSPARNLVLLNPSPLFFDKKPYFKNRVLQGAIEIMNNMKEHYSKLEIHSVYEYEESDESNAFLEELSEHFTEMPNWEELKYLY